MRRVFVAVVFFAQLASAQSPPSLPTKWIPTTLTVQNFPGILSGTPVTKKVCASGCDYKTLQAAWNDIKRVAPNCNEIITVTAGYNAVNLGDGQWLVYSMACPAGTWVWTRTSAYAALPEQGSDTRTCTVNNFSYPCAVNASDKPNMFQIRKVNAGSAYDEIIHICGDSTSDGSPGDVTPNCVVHSPAASGLIMTGADIEWSGTRSSPQVYIAVYGGTVYDVVPPSNIIFDRNYLDSLAGDWSVQVAHGWFMNGSYIALVDNYINHTWVRNDTGIQSTDFLMVNGSGPVKIVNNFLGGTDSMKGMFGGGDSGPACRAPTADIEVRRNVMVNDTYNVGTPGSALGSNAAMAALFEFKCCWRRALFEANTLHFIQSQAPYYNQSAPVITVKQDMNSNYPTKFGVSDLTIRYNDAWGFNYAVVILGLSQNTGGTGSSPTGRVAIHDNLFRGANDHTYANPGGNSPGGFLFESEAPFTIHGPNDVNVHNNGLYSSPRNNSGTTYWAGVPGTSRANGTRLDNFAFTYNAVVVDGQNYSGRAGQAFMEGDGGFTMATLFSFGVFPGGKFANNVLFNYRHNGSCGKVGHPCTCSSTDWGAVNPGICPAGLSSSPSTIDSTLGTADYATCAAGGPITSCALTNPPITGVGPDIPAMQKAMALGNDAYVPN